jgi:CheY-like chemotaxis protein
VSTVLVVDDDPHIRASLRRTLGFEGYRVRQAADGIGALAAVAEERPELVILDLMLPGMDGVEVCRRLRQIDDVPVLMLTALERTPDRVKGLDAGADDYLVKPFATERAAGPTPRPPAPARAGEGTPDPSSGRLVLDERAVDAPPQHEEGRRSDRSEKEGL